MWLWALTWAFLSRDLAFALEKELSLAMQRSVYWPVWWITDSRLHRERSSWYHRTMSGSIQTLVNLWVSSLNEQLNRTSFNWRLRVDGSLSSSLLSMLVTISSSSSSSSSSNKFLLTSRGWDPQIAYYIRWAHGNLIDTIYSCSSSL